MVLKRDLLLEALENLEMSLENDEWDMHDFSHVSLAHTLLLDVVGVVTDRSVKSNEN